MIILTSAFSVLAQPQPGGGPAPVISEIMYNPPESGSDSLEFIEILNPSLVGPLDISGFTMEGVSMTFPENTVIQPGGFLVIAGNASAVQTVFGVTALEWDGAANQLVNTGELLVILDANGDGVDSVEYAATGAWPSEADGEGYSLVLCDPTADNNDPANWALSNNNTGETINEIEVFADPGEWFTCVTVGVDEAEEGTFSVYPNPTEGLFSMNMEGLQGGTLRIVSSMGQLVHTQELTGNTSVLSMDLPLSAGLYVVSVETPEGVFTERLIVRQ